METSPNDGLKRYRVRGKSWLWRTLAELLADGGLAADDVLEGSDHSTTTLLNAATQGKEGLRVVADATAGAVLLRTTVEEAFAGSGSTTLESFVTPIDASAMPIKLLDLLSGAGEQTVPAAQHGATHQDGDSNGDASGDSQEPPGKPHAPNRYAGRKRFLEPAKDERNDSAELEAEANARLPRPDMREEYNVKQWLDRLSGERRIEVIAHPTEIRLRANKITHAVRGYLIQSNRKRVTTIDAAEQQRTAFKFEDQTLRGALTWDRIVFLEHVCARFSIEADLSGPRAQLSGNGARYT